MLAAIACDGKLYTDSATNMLPILRVVFELIILASIFTRMHPGTGYEFLSHLENPTS